MSRQRIILLLIFLLAAAMFLTGINWGLPSRDADRFLFGNRKPWTGAEIIALSGGWDESADRGADIAKNILVDRSHPIVLNETDAQRAQIVQRYRLYSQQPDEMITFRALSRMKPSKFDFDPRFYQYGGLFVYPVGALIKLFASPKSDLAYYLDHPEAFAKFYLIARLYVVMWGLIGVGVVYKLTKEWTGKFFAGALAATFYSLLPVVVNSAHEAKPHLPGAVLMMAACYFALRYVRCGKTKWAILAGVSCGMSFAMVLTGMLSFVVLPVMVMLRPISRSSRMKTVAITATIGLGVFVLTNTYLPYNYLFNRSVVKSNVGNYGNFYKPEMSLEGFANSANLLAEGMSLPLAAVGTVGCIWLMIRGKSNRGLIFAAPTGLVLLQFLLLAHEKPAEYARFALPADIILAVSAATAISSLGKKGGQMIIATLVIACAGVSSLRYVHNFTANHSRDAAAQSIRQRTGNIVAIFAEPAPYGVPPIDLFQRQLSLEPRYYIVSPYQTRVKAVDRPDGTPWLKLSPISWANKPFEIN